jgi:uncharacterized protein YgiM (DUF1202 family)
MIKLLWIGAVAVAGAALLLPGADEPAQANAIEPPRAEAQLIASLRELAKAPEAVATQEVAWRAPEPVAEITPTPVVETRREQLIVTSEALNLRAGPNKTTEILGRLMRGEAVEVEARENGWVRVASSSGATGWASEKFLVAVQN